MSSLSSPSDIAKLVDAFQAEPGTVPFQVIIGTTEVMAQGLNLHRACRLALMEPSRHISVELQAHGRSHRIGSCADPCWFYRLINPDSEIELELVNDQIRQAEHDLLIERSQTNIVEQDYQHTEEKMDPIGSTSSWGVQNESSSTTSRLTAIREQPVTGPPQWLRSSPRTTLDDEGDDPMDFDYVDDSEHMDDDSVNSEAESIISLM